ncbi:hypothetical protein [Robertmurraya sp.]|uniref:hypothetical protein n=1 Tax=Robertmurraya sp. TaxID=2837525 RepID=UPI003703BC36
MKNWLVRHKWDIPLAIVFLVSLTIILQVQLEGTSWYLLQSSFKYNSKELLGIC